MFVFEALTLTCLTTPTVLFLYPEHKRTRVSATGPDYHKPADEAEGGKLTRQPSSGVDEDWKTRFTVVIDKLEHLPGMMTLTQLILPPQSLRPGSFGDLMAKRSSSVSSTAP